MNLGKTLSVSAVALGLSLGALTLGAAGCGSSASQVKAEQKSCGAGSCGDKKMEGDKGGEGAEKSCGAKTDDPAKDGGEKSCGAGSCGG